MCIILHSLVSRLLSQVCTVAEKDTAAAAKAAVGRPKAAVGRQRAAHPSAAAGRRGSAVPAIPTYTPKNYKLLVYKA